MVTVTLVALPLWPLLGWGFLRRGQTRLGWTLLWTIAICLVTTVLFYYLALRPRPVDVRLVLPMPPLPGYPSGHMALASALAMVFALALRRWWLTSIAIVGALLIGYSRVYLRCFALWLASWGPNVDRPTAMVALEPDWPGPDWHANGLFGFSARALVGLAAGRQSLSCVALRCGGLLAELVAARSAHGLWAVVGACCDSDSLYLGARGRRAPSLFPVADSRSHRSA
ncbi:MAG: phosphatase PAP2 family protein [Caldilineaceae bacterium]|nr:phosphatase PAP2 family protein [Caldilineaceae bacterium]